MWRPGGTWLSQLGNRTGKSKPDATTITYTYDALDRLVDIGAPGLSVVYAYDAVGGRTAMTDTTGTTAFVYDALNRLTGVQYPASSVTYGYDAVGNRTGITYPDAEAATYVYDAADRMTGVTDWGGKVLTYTHDAAGQLVSTSYPNGVTAAYTYNTAGWVTAITHTSTVSGTLAHFAYTYDNVGNRLSEASSDGTMPYSYDALDRLTQAGYPDGETVSYSYEATARG